MKKFIIIVIAILVMATTIQVTSAGELLAQNSTIITPANLELNDIFIQKLSDRTNVSAIVKNVGTMPARYLKNHLILVLRVKDPVTGNWRELQRWYDINTIKPGETVTRDLSKANTMDPAIMANNFTIQAEISLEDVDNMGKEDKDCDMRTVVDVSISRAIMVKVYP